MVWKKPLVPMVFQWFLVYQPLAPMFFSLATIGLDGFAMVFGLATIGLDGFSMVGQPLVKQWNGNDPSLWSTLHIITNVNRHIVNMYYRTYVSHVCNVHFLLYIGGAYYYQCE